MNSFSGFLEGFSPELYLSTLVKMAHADGLHPIEEAFLNQQAVNLGLDLTLLPEVPDDLSELPWSTRILVYRDALMLAYADGMLSEKEQDHLANLAQGLNLRETTITEITAWVNDYNHLLNRLERLTQAPN